MMGSVTDKSFEGRMRSKTYQKYIDDDILTADPMKLVQLLYQGALDAVGDARANLARGDVKGRSAGITKAIEILTELSATLNHEQGGELSARLAALYDYMQRRLIVANQQQTDPPLAEVSGLLQTLAEAWLSVNESTSRVDMQRVSDSAAPYGKVVENDGYVPLSCAC